MKDIEPVIIDELSSNMEIDLHDKRSIDELRLALSGYINYLISHDMNKLMRILYKVDVSEKILKTSLQTSDKEPGDIIAGLIVDRQLEKMETRQRFKSKDDVPEDEKW